MAFCLSVREAIREAAKKAAADEHALSLSRVCLTEYGPVVMATKVDVQVSPG